MGLPRAQMASMQLRVLGYSDLFPLWASLQLPMLAALTLPRHSGLLSPLAPKMASACSTASPMKQAEITIPTSELLWVGPLRTVPGWFGPWFSLLNWFQGIATKPWGAMIFELMLMVMPPMESLYYSSLPTGCLLFTRLPVPHPSGMVVCGPPKSTPPSSLHLPFSWK